jgi:recombinational DNA repair protein RecR
MVYYDDFDERPHTYSACDCQFCEMLADSPVCAICGEKKSDKIHEVPVEGSQSRMVN